MWEPDVGCPFGFRRHRPGVRRWPAVFAGADRGALSCVLHRMRVLPVKKSRGASRPTIPSPRDTILWPEPLPRQPLRSEGRNCRTVEDNFIFGCRRAAVLAHLWGSVMRVMRHAQLRFPVPAGCHFGRPAQGAVPRGSSGSVIAATPAKLDSAPRIAAQPVTHVRHPGSSALPTSRGKPPAGNQTGLCSCPTRFVRGSTIWKPPRRHSRRRFRTGSRVPVNHHGRGSVC